MLKSEEPLKDDILLMQETIANFAYIFLKNKKNVSFYVSGNSEFSSMAALAIRSSQMRAACYSSKLITVFPFISYIDEFNARHFDLAIYPLGEKKILKAQGELDKWLVDNCDFLFLYSKERCFAEEYAKSKKIHFLNLNNI